MHRVKCLILLLFAFLSFTIQGQDTGNFTQFFFNPYSLNPSFAGIDGRGAAFFGYRKQWSGIEGGPTIGNFSFHTPLKGGLNFGLNAANDQRGLLSNSGLLFSVAYNISFDKHKFLRFGISGGGAWNTIDLNKLEGALASDPAITNLLNKNASILSNAGLSLHIENFHLGVALPTLFAPAYVSKDAFTITEVAPASSVIIHASNRFYFAKNKHVFEPYLVYRINNGLPTQYEAAGVLHLNHLIWLGGSYKQDFGISALGGIKLNKTFALGGSYTLKNTGVNELSFPTFEVQLSYIGKPKKQTKAKGKTPPPTLPSYSFVDTELKKLTAKERKQEELAKKAAEEKKAKEALARKEAEAKKVEEAQAKIEAAKQKQLEEQARKEAERKQREEAIAAQKNNQTQPPATNQEPVVEEKKPEEIIETAPRPRYMRQQELIIEEDFIETVVHGPHPKELAPNKYYLVTSSLGHEEEAQDAVNKMKQAGLQANYGYISETGHWYPYEYAGSDLEAARKERDEIHKIPGYSSSWVLKVNAELNVRHEYEEQGEHAKELDLGTYVIVGVFRTEPHARDFATSVSKNGITAKYGFLTKRGFWYVHIFKESDINKAKSERDEYHTRPEFRHAWLLTVQ